MELHGRKRMLHMLIMSDAFCCHSIAYFLVKLTRDIRSLVIFPRNVLSCDSKNRHSLQYTQDPL